MKNRACLMCIITICLSYLTATSVCAVSQGKSSELLHYHTDGGTFSSGKTDIVVNTDASGKVMCTTMGYDNSERKRFPQNIDYKFRLSSDEFEALKVRIREADLFGQPDKDTQFADDTDKSVMRISIDGRKREITYRYRPEMYPIEGFLRKLINQAKALDALKQGKSAYEAHSGISPGSASGYGVLQPYVFPKPIREYIHTQDSQRKLYWAVSALSILSTSEEWLGFWTAEVREAKDPRRTMLLRMLSDQSSDIKVTAAQQKALVPLLFQYLQQDYRNWPQLSDAKRDVCWYTIQYLNREHYAKAVPVFVDMMKQGFEMSKLDSQTFPQDMLAVTLTSAVSAMGYEGISAAEPLLADPKPRIREFAVNVMSFAVPHTPDTIYLYSGEPVDADSQLKRLKGLAPRLKQIAESDPDPLVVGSAKSALERIEMGWNVPVPSPSNISK